MMIQSGDSILARQSRAELLDVLLSNSLELNKNLEKWPNTKYGKPVMVTALTCCLLRYSFISFSWLASTALLCSMAALQWSCWPLSWGFTSVWIPKQNF